MLARIRKLEESKKAICFTLDVLIRMHDLERNPQGKGVGIFDLRGVLACLLWPCRSSTSGRQGQCLARPEL